MVLRFNYNKPSMICNDAQTSIIFTSLISILLVILLFMSKDMLQTAINSITDHNAGLIWIFADVFAFVYDVIHAISIILSNVFGKLMLVNRISILSIYHQLTITVISVCVSSSVT